MKVELVIFDMDGLMIDTEPISKEGWQMAFDRYGYKMDHEFFKLLVGRNLDAVKQLLCEHYGPGFDFEKVRDIRIAHVHNHIEQHGLDMKKGLIYILDRLDKLKIKKCVATSTDWDGMTKKLGSLNLLERFDGFMTGDRVENSKPNPEIFLKAAKLVNVSPASSVVLEDSPAGIAAAHAAGMRGILIPDTIPPDKETLELSYARCKDLTEAAGLIEKLCK